MNLLLCAGSFDPVYGGPSISVSQLGAELARAGVTVGLWAPDGSAVTSTLVKKEERLLPLAGNLRQVVRSFQSDIVYDNGIWLPHNHSLARLAAHYNLPRAFSIRGMLEPWPLAHKRMKKSSPGSPIRNATSTEPQPLFRGSRRVRGSLLDYGMWGGVIVYMMIYGVILSVLTNLTARSLREGKWLLLPVVLMALLMGFCTDGRYISDIAGASVIAAWIYLILSFSDRVLRSLSRPKYPLGLAIRSLRAPSTESRR